MTDRLQLAAVHFHARALPREIKRAGLPQRHADDDYLMHAALCGTFGPGVLGPFRAEARGSTDIRVLAYTTASANDLRKLALQHADPEWYQAVDVERIATKPMPTSFPVGTELAFGLRACPVKRVPRGHPTRKPGAEVDAFLLACDAEPESARVDRDAIYRAWLGQQLQRHGAEVQSTQIDGFQLKRMTRRRGEPGARKSRQFDRPVIQVTGALRVTDAARFAAAVRDGIGRHRAFGFGMLLLRPPS